MNKAAAWLWILFLALCAAFSAQRIAAGAFDASIGSLLPQAQGVLSQADAQAVAQAFERRITVLLACDEQAANRAQSAVAALPGAGKVLGAVANPAAVGRFLAENRLSLVDPATRDRLANAGAAQLRRILSLMSRPGGPGASELAADPLLLVRSSLSSVAGKLVPCGTWLCARDAKGRDWRMLLVEAQPGKAAGLANAVRSSLAAQGIRFAMQSAALYADRAAQMTRSDLTRLGPLSTLAVIAIFAAAFGSAGSLALAAAAMLAGLAAGLAAVFAIFGTVSLSTLVMSVGLIGLATDYTAYWVAERSSTAELEPPAVSMRRLAPSMAAAMLTSVLAYGALALAPFPGLRQLAAFAAAGLASACLTVVLAFPLVPRLAPSRPLALAGAAQRLRPPRTILWALAAAVLVWMGMGLSRVAINDDVGALADRPADLMAEEQQISSLLQSDFSQSLFVVKGEGDDEALDRKDALVQRLEALRRKGLVQGWTAPLVTGPAARTADSRLVAAAMPRALEQLTRLGVAAHPAQARTGLTLRQWEASAAGSSSSALIVRRAHTTLILVPVRGASKAFDPRSVCAGLPGVAWLDRRSELSQAFAASRALVMKLTLAALAAAFVLHGLFFGWKRALLAVCLVASSALAGVAGLGIAGEPLTVFGSFAALLVMGLAADYAIFGLSGRKGSGLYAVSVAALTTIATLGLPMWSSASAVRGFSIVASSGVAAAWILSAVFSRLEARNDLR